MPIEIKKVSVKKGGNTILNNISFKDQNGENWVIIGPSGAGKSTFLDLLAGKAFASEGIIKKDASKKYVLVSRDYSFHRIVGGAYQYYQQRYNAYDSAIGPTVYEVFQNQVLPIGTIDMDSVELPPPLYAESFVEKTAEKFRIKHLLNRKITTLSNGETRRTLLTYWFLQQPDVILLDNPFSGLDTQSRNELKEILDGLNDVQIFLIADGMDIPYGFENIIILENGEITFTGNRDKSPGFRAENRIALPKKTPNIHSNTLPDFDIAVKLVNVRVKYGGKSVLQDVNWEVKKGESWAVLGPNGSGKTTLMSLLTGDNPQAYGNEIYLFDRRRGTGESIWDIKKRIGFVSPELHLFFNRYTPVWKVIGSGFFDTMGLFRKLSEEQEVLLDRYLDAFNIIKLKNKPLGHLSSGKQRVMFLIRALVKNPQLLILDEPSQGLDYSQMVFFRETLNQIVTSQQKTMIYITHLPEEIPACVNKTLHLSEGRIVKADG